MIRKNNNKSYHSALFSKSSSTAPSPPPSFTPNPIHIRGFSLVTTNFRQEERAIIEDCWPIARSVYSQKRGKGIHYTSNTKATRNP